MKTHTLKIEITTPDTDEYKREYPTWFVAQSFMETVEEQKESGDFIDLPWDIKLVSPTEKEIDKELKND